MAVDPPTLTRPPPFFFHAATRRFFYISAGPCPLVFSISRQDLERPPRAGDSVSHPFGRTTTVASLADDALRRELGEARPFESGVLDASLSRWANFCDDVADRLNEGEPLAEALNDTWTLRDGDDVQLDDDTEAPVRR
jgi:hypothetical protein